MRAIAVTAFAFALAIAAAPSVAFEVEQSVALTGTHKNVSIFTINNTTFTVTQIPSVADSLETFETPPENYLEGTKGLTLGNPITQDEAIKVIEEYYRQNAINFASIRVRKVNVSNPQYAAWCSARLFVCTDREFRSGNLVEFEINGGNQLGGMTGYQRQIFMIRKL